MKIRAAIFDIYGTVLEVGPAPPNADAEWARLWSGILHRDPSLSRLEFSIACGRIISREHEAARRHGIPYPEVNWTAIVGEAVPETQTLPPEDRERFILGQIRAGHTTQVSAQAAEALRGLKDMGCLLGIASNAQAYTLTELEQGLQAHGLRLNDFEPDLCFWSYQHGFSKPDPHVFRILSARLELRGIPGSQTVMVGDRADNDILPAQLSGWQTWHLHAPGQGGNGGWKELLASIR